MEQLLEKLDQCPSCSDTQQHPWLECVDFSVSKRPFSIMECERCGLRFTNPRPSADAIGPYYNSPEYVSHNDTSEGLLFSLYQAVKAFTLKRKAKLLAKSTNGRTLLDYGAGTGDFAGSVAQQGWNVMAFEPDGSARQRIKEKYPNIQLQAGLNQIADASRAVITLWHVLEHVHTLQETMQHFQRILSKQGTLIIAVPNCNSYDAQHYREYWAAYDVPRHLYHFTPSDLEALMEKCGFLLVAKHPMWFDSYYVSLLSERYRDTSTGTLRNLIKWLKALSTGTISNLKAITDTDRCSSIIYILKKA
ncbi:MAG: class I SAM-dependent methyltransferase [Flavobacteriales bacterium]|nr:class I SAM-dependent methyltransferase [Flavobacteriales bacterium]